MLNCPNADGPGPTSKKSFLNPHGAISQPTRLPRPARGQTSQHAPLMVVCKTREQQQIPLIRLEPQKTHRPPVKNGVYF